MAEEDLSLEEPKEGDDESTESSGGNKKLIIIIIALASVIVIGGGVAAWLLLSGDDETDEGAQEQTEVIDTEAGSEASDTDAAGEGDPKQVPPPPKGEAIYVSIPDPFLVNIKSGKRSRMMQVRVQLMVRSEEAEDAVKLHMPLIRNNLLDFFSTADADVVGTREGRKELKDEAFKVAQEVIVAQAGFEAIEMILFTGFVIQ